MLRKLSGDVHQLSFAYISALDLRAKKEKVNPHQRFE